MRAHAWAEVKGFPYRPGDPFMYLGCARCGVRVWSESPTPSRDELELSAGGAPEDCDEAAVWRVLGS